MTVLILTKKLKIRNFLATKYAYLEGDVSDASDINGIARFKSLTVFILEMIK